MARSMLSFGIETARAFSMAFCSEMLASGSPPPSFDATMMARDSLLKRMPRFLSAAPFLCLIVDHLECPDMRALSCFSGHGAGVGLADPLKESLVQTPIAGQLGMERRHHDRALGGSDRLGAVPRDHLDALADALDARRPDEHP